MDIPVAEPEKAMAAAFHYPRYCGGMAVVVAAVGRARASVDLGRLGGYAMRTGSDGLCSRLGYVVKGLGAEPQSLRSHVPDTHVKLDPRGSRRGRISRCSR